ncbi:MAG: hypothetical protein JW940_02130 [Polyangiaceae bacterium]|nr:hypothetical protein [Polyangiaceae bacterium]
MRRKVKQNGLSRRVVGLPCAALSALLGVGCAEQRANTASEFPAPFLEVQELAIRRGPQGGCPIVFNDKRCYAISINRGTPSAEKLRAGTVEDLAARHVLEQVVFEWFGPTESDAVQLDIGRDVPVAVAQSLLTASSRLRGVPVSVEVTTRDGGVGDTQRVYVNSLVAARKKPISELKMRALLVPGISEEEFYGGCRGE